MAAKINIFEDSKDTRLKELCTEQLTVADLENRMSLGRHERILKANLLALETLVKPW